MERREVGGYEFSAFNIGGAEQPKETTPDTKQEIYSGDVPNNEPQDPQEPEVKDDVTPPAQSEPNAPAAEDDDDDEDMTASAIIFKSLVEEGLEYKDTINPKMTGRDLIESLKNTTKEEVRAELEAEYQKLGYNETFKRDLDFIRNGGSLDDLKTLIDNQKYSEMDINDDVDQSNREIVVKAFYRDKGIPENKLDKMWEMAKENDETYEESLVAQAYFKERDEAMYAQQAQIALQEKEAEEKQVTEYVNSVKQILKTNKLGDIEISAYEAKAIEKALLEPTEVFDYVDENGKKKQTKITKVQLLEQQFRSNPEQQLLFVKLLLDGFKFDKITNKSIKRRDDQIVDKLNGRLSKTIGDKAIKENIKNNQTGTNTNRQMVGEYSY